jgi:hypothetical protein
MKGGRAPPPGHHSRHISSSSRSSSRRSSSRRSSISSILNNRLQALGFEEGELEMFFDMTNISEDELVRKYLDIAQHPPYNLNWGSEETAIRADYMLGVYKRNGVEYTKHDIVEDTFTYFYDQAEGRAQGIRKKKRGTRKHRSSKRKQTRRHRRRH